MAIKKNYGSLITIIPIIFAMTLVASATDRGSSAYDFDPDYPVGTPPILGGTGYVTETNDGDGWYVAQDWQDYNSDYEGYHPGEDWNSEEGGSSDVGTPVYAIAGGFVVGIKDNVMPSGDYGSGIVIEHALPDGEIIYSVYVHIDIASGLIEGDFVGQGDRIGTIADTTSVPPHLHFEIRTIPVGQYWYLNDNGLGYYMSVENLYADGLTVNPSNFIDSHRHTDARSSVRTLDWITIKRNYINLEIECENGKCGKQDKYGHYWIEILDGPDGKPIESYGWWPKSEVGPMETLFGVQGELNGITNFGGTSTSDPHQGDIADEDFHPQLTNAMTDQQVLDKIHEFVQSYKGEWRWTLGSGQNCRTFQAELMDYVGLTK